MKKKECSNQDGFFSNKDFLPLRSGHLDIKDAQCAETKEKSCVRFFRFLVIGVLNVQKDAQKIKFSSKVVKFTGKIRTHLTIIFGINHTFCAILSF